MNINNYIRVGTKYFKKIWADDGTGIKRRQIIQWSRETIIDDLGKEVLKQIEKYDGFINYPDNKNYQQIIDNKWNVYQPMPFKEATEAEYKEPTKTLDFIKHIFGDMYEIGLKYLKVLYEMPRQKLPILVLTSRERMTGKSTFIDYVVSLFGENSTILDPTQMTSAFNSSYSNKVVIAIEETEFQSKVVSEKLKALATLNKISVNTKGLPEYEAPFYGKLILASNNEDRFAMVSDDEIRYFVVVVPKIEKLNVNILKDMLDEAPNFLYYLSNYVEVEVKTRMVFTEEEIKTDALQNVKNESKSNLAKDILITLELLGDQYPEEEYFYFTSADMQVRFKNISLHYINRVLTKELGFVKTTSNITFKSINDMGNVNPYKRGFAFRYKNKNYNKDAIMGIV